MTHIPLIETTTPATDRLRSDLIIAILSVVLGIVVIYLTTFSLGVLLARCPLGGEIKSPLLAPEAAIDDRLDQYTYLTCLVVLPVITFISAMTFTKWVAKFRDSQKAVISFFSVVIAVLFFATDFHFRRYISVPFEWLYLVPLACLSGLFVFVSYQFTLSKRLLLITCLIFIAGLASAKFTPNSPTPVSYHFEPVVYNFVQLLSGKTLLTGDLIPSYGAYNFFIWLFGSSVIHSVGSYTFALAFLHFVGVSALVVFLFSAIAQAELAFGASIILIFANSGMFDTIGEIYSTAEPYFQYTPIRALVPSLMIALTWFYFRLPSLKSYIGLSALAACSVLWNVDTGLVVWGAWLLVDMVRSYLNSGFMRGTGRALICQLGALTICLGIFIIFNLVIHRQAPDLSKMFFYQKIFSRAGYMMLPMPLFGTWVGVIAIYIFSFARFCLDVARDKSSPRTFAYLFITILGCGLFSYYVGRSHIQNILGPLYPALILLFVFIDEAVETRVVQSRLSGRSLRLVVAILAAIAILKMSIYTSKTIPVLMTSLNAENTILDEAVADITQMKAETGASDILVVSNVAGLFQLQSRTNIPKEWRFPAFGEILTKDMLQDQLKTIESKTVSYIWLGTKYNPLGNPQDSTYNLTVLSDSILFNYRLIKKTAGAMWFARY